MEQKPQVSFIIPVHNDEDFVDECVKSALGQTFTDLELILVDDGSVDRTPEILNGLAKGDKRVKLLVNPKRKGIAFSRNKGFAASRGRHIAVLDSDDVAILSRIEKQVEFLRNNSCFSGCGTFFEFVDKKGNAIDIKDTTVTEGEITDVYNDPSSFCHPTLLLRREVFETTGGYREEFARGVDYDFLLRVLERYRLVTIPEVLTRQRFHISRGTIKERRKQLLYCELARKLADQRRSVGKDVLQSGDTEAFETMKKELFGNLPAWIERSGNYLYWAKRMYHRGPLDFARDMVKESIRYNPFNLKAWFYAAFLYSDEGTREKLTSYKRKVSGE